MNISGKKIALGILMAFAVLVGIIGIIGSLYIGTYVISIVLGSIFQVTKDVTDPTTNITTQSSLPLNTETETFLNTTETSYFTSATNVLSGSEFASSLIPIAVILLVFAGLIVGGTVLYKKFGKGKGGNMDY